MGSCLSSDSPEQPTPAANSTQARLSFKSKSRNKKKHDKKQRSSKERDRKRPGGGANVDAAVEDELHRVKGRLFFNGASEVACLYTQQGRKGTNQDAMIVWENFASKGDTIFCGVFDGHGPFGHMVARKVRDALPVKISSQWHAYTDNQGGINENVSAQGSMNSEETASIGIDDEWGESLEVDEAENLPEFYPALKQSFLKAFKLMDKELKLHPTIDCFCSGSTAVTIVKQGEHLVIGNVGDSRAVLGTRDKDNKLVPLQLTVDLKPNLPREAARIQQCRGRVFALQDEPEVARVWLPNNDSPGLAMARAFGDFCLKDYGLISVPDMSYRHLTDRDEFVVLATDGVWDVLSNKEVVDIIAGAPTRATAARALVDTAVRAWRLRFPTSKSDDCAAVCLFLNSGSSSKIAPTKSVEIEIAGITSTDKESNKEEPGKVGVKDEVSYNPILEHSNTLRGADEIVPVSEDPKVERMPDKSQSKRSLADCISLTDDEEWSALEGVTRVNSLLNLPRFLSGDKRSNSRRK